MKKLFIARHAKSSWSEEKEDFDRGLKKRGISNAPFMAEKIISRRANIDKIISSSSKRTKKTTKLFNEVFKINEANIEYTRDLYLASPKKLISIIKDTDDSVDELMIVAHNPAVTLVVNHLANEYFENIPTCGVACILFDINSWSELSNKGTLGFYIYPKLFKNKQ